MPSRADNYWRSPTRVASSFSSHNLDGPLREGTSIPAWYISDSRYRDDGREFTEHLHVDPAVQRLLGDRLQLAERLGTAPKRCNRNSGLPRLRFALDDDDQRDEQHRIRQRLHEPPGVSELSHRFGRIRHSEQQRQRHYDSRIERGSPSGRDGTLHFQHRHEWAQFQQQYAVRRRFRRRQCFRPGEFHLHLAVLSERRVDF